MVSLTIPGVDIDTGNGISHVMLNKTTGLKPITFVRAIHDSRTCANRFYLQGIRVTDQQFGYSVNYLVDQYIRLEPLQTAVKHSIVRPRVDLLWTQLMRPLFWHSDRCPTKLMATPVQYPTYGFLVLPMLTLTERLMFQSYLLSLLYFYNNLLANLLSTLPLFDNICLFKLSVPVASCLAFNSTNFIAYFYRSALKSNHRSNDISQSFRQKLCSLLKSMFSLYLPVMSIILLLYPLKFDSSSSVLMNRRLFVDNQSSDESIVNLLYYMSSLVLCLTLWPLIAGLFRCLYLCLVGCPQSERFDDLVDNSINLNEMSIEKTETSIDNNNIVYKDIFKNNSNCIVWAHFVDTIQQNGWSKLELHTNQHWPDSYQAYYAGLIEGYLTHQLITDHYFNKLDGYFTADDDEYKQKLQDFVEKNIKFMTTMLTTANNPYWHCVGLVLYQLTGLQDGYNWAINGSGGGGGGDGDGSNKSVLLEVRIDIKPMDKVFLLNLIPDLDVLEEVFDKQSRDRLLLGEGHHCSAIVKPLADGSDLLVGHNMWSTYHSMLRVIKKYDFGYHLDRETTNEPLIPGSCMSMSSYPGAVLSCDDFYILSSGLVVLETTFEILNNRKLWSGVRPDSTVPEFIRVLVANRLARSGSEWSELFGRYNSGTYNSQFMIVDYNRYRCGLRPDQLPDDVLWITEQLPDMMHSEDMTEMLRRDHYWSSYNIPYFEDIYRRAGYPELVEKYGQYFSRTNSPRARIFRRDHCLVRDIQSMMRLMRSNSSPTDPLSRYPGCRPPYSADLAIAGRNDLNDPDGYYSIPVLGFRPRGAIDAKITSSKLIETNRMFAVSGPTNQSLPTFQWSTTSVKGIRHRGQPDKWDFQPVYVDWLL
ncbi:putative phospholipase B-like 2 [Oppia nitens]|uniref:putative phospholipase B-like 2 n=1 Tax=Oppia nitens TaxID=1686743 RepID=UPI0023DC30A1|nr:putative phospholipase B-like 2 [Oppia nitens]